MIPFHLLTKYGDLESKGHTRFDLLGEHYTAFLSVGVMSSSVLVSLLLWFWMLT